MKKDPFEFGAVVVDQICSRLGYTRPHVANILRANAARLGAMKRGGRWVIPKRSISRLENLVRETSGKRYKLGERGAH